MRLLSLLIPLVFLLGCGQNGTVLYQSDCQRLAESVAKIGEYECREGVGSRSEDEVCGRIAVYGELAGVFGCSFAVPDTFPGGAPGETPEPVE